MLGTIIVIGLYVVACVLALWLGFSVRKRELARMAKVNFEMVGVILRLARACEKTIQMLESPGCTCGAHETIVPHLRNALAEAERWVGGKNE